MRIIFAGTPDFAATQLQGILQATQHSVCAVLTQPDRRKGRGKRYQASPVKQLAQSYEIPVYQPPKLTDQALEDISHLKPDVMVVVAYGSIVPQAWLDWPKYGGINVHASLLPRWRGAAPIQRAILAGDTVSGVTIMKMVRGLDRGDILLQISCSITQTTTASRLHDELAELGQKALIKVLDDLPGYLQAAQPQDHTLSCYAHKLQKQEGRIDWQQPAQVIDRQIRALTPWPGCYTGDPQEQVIYIRQAQVLDTISNYSAGTIMALNKQGIDVATGEGVLRLQQLQMPGKKVLQVQDLLNGRQLQWQAGQVLGQYE